MPRFTRCDFQNFSRWFLAGNIVCFKICVFFLYFYIFPINKPCYIVLIVIFFVLIFMSAFITVSKKEMAMSVFTFGENNSDLCCSIPNFITDNDL